MNRFRRIPRYVSALALVALPLAASAQGGHLLNDATSIGLANRYVLYVGNDSTPFQKVEITWTAPTSRMMAPRPGASPRSTDTDRTGAASVKFTRAASTNETQKVKTWLQHGSTLEPVHVTAFDANGKIVGTMTAPAFKADSWSINSMNAGASQAAVETLEVSTPSLHVQGAAFGN